MCFCALPPIDIILFFGKCFIANNRFAQHTNHTKPHLDCGDCSTRSDGSEPGPSILCDLLHPKRKANVVNWSIPAASAAVASSVPAKFVPKCGPVSATPPSGLVFDIIGIAAGERGCRCEDNMVCYGDLLEEDSVVQRVTLLA